MPEQVKVKVGFLYSATYMVNTQNSCILQSWKWRLIGKSHWCCSTNGVIHCMRKCTIEPATAASKHTTTQINYTRPSPHEHSPDVATWAR